MVNIVSYGKSNTRTKVNDIPEAFFEILKDWDADIFYVTKQYRALGLNKENKVVCKFVMEDPRINEDLTPLLEKVKDSNATKIIIGENSIFGAPSANDKMWDVYEKLKENAKLLDIDVVDQLVMARRSYFSFAENEPHKYEYRSQLEI